MNKSIPIYISFFETMNDLILKEEEKIITFLVVKIGRKWIQCTAKYKEYTLDWNVALNNISSDWKIGQAYTVPVEIKIERSSYGTKRYATPLSEELKASIHDKQELENQIKIEKDIIRYLGYIEEKINEYWYAKGQENIESLFKKYKNEEKKIEFNKKLQELENIFKINNAKKEIKRWLGYIKDNLSTYWYSKGEDNVLKYAKIIKEVDKYKIILSDLKKEFNNTLADKKVSDTIKKYGSNKSINISNNYENREEGDTFYSEKLNKWITIIKIVKEWYGLEDAMSFGGNADGYVVSAYYRDATEAEENKEKEILAKKSEYKRKIGIIMKYFEFHSANTPNNVSYSEVGKIYHFKNSGHNIYGGGSALGISNNNLWIIKNNGMDGDDWGKNNFSTGGAGAIASKYPYNEEIADLIREICLEGLNEKYIQEYKSFFENNKMYEAIKWKYVIRNGKRVKKPVSSNPDMRITYDDNGHPKEVRMTGTEQSVLSRQNKKSSKKAKSKKTSTARKVARSKAKRTWD